MVGGIKTSPDGGLNTDMNDVMGPDPIIKSSKKKKVKRRVSSRKKV